MEGWDTARKICILAALACGKIPSLEQIPVEGITRITAADIANARKAGYTIKLVGTADLTERPRVQVCPRLVPASSPLSTISDVFNGILVRSEFLGDVMFYGRGAARCRTASAVVSDILDIAAAHPANPGPGTRRQTSIWLTRPPAPAAGISALAQSRAGKASLPKNWARRKSSTTPDVK